jgi:hypothetical protein
MRLYLASAFALLLAVNSTQAVADPFDDKVGLYSLEACKRLQSGERKSLDFLNCAIARKENGLELHYEFACKAGLFNKTETYQVYGNWKTSKGEALDNIPPWYFIPIEASEDKERTLVIHETKLSAAIVTKTRRFSNSKGYYWDEEKFYCQREHYPH